MRLQNDVGQLCIIIHDKPVDEKYPDNKYLLINESNMQNTCTETARIYAFGFKTVGV